MADRRISAIMLLTATALLIGALPPAVFAESQPASPITAPSDQLTRLEALGLYQNAAEGALDPEIWMGMKRSEAIELMQSMPAFSPIAPTQRLIQGMLLSGFNMDRLSNDTQPQDGNDLFTLRLEKLVDGGAYDQAFNLYSNVQDTPYHPRLAQAGITAMMMAGKKSLACLEAQSAIETFPEDGFLKTVHALCHATRASGTAAQEDVAALKDFGQALLEKIAENKHFRFDYTPENFSALPRLTQAALIAEKRLNVPALDSASARKVPAAHVQALLNGGDLSADNRFLLTAQAVAYGLEAPRAMAALFAETLKPAAGSAAGAAAPAKKAPAVKASADWEALAALYMKASTAPDDASALTALREAFGYADRYGVTTLAPFADIAMRLTPRGLAMPEFMTGFRLFNALGQDVPKPWVDAVESHYGPFPDMPLYTRLLLAAALHENAPSVRAMKLGNLRGFLPLLDKKDAFFMTNVIENVDNDKIVHNNADKIYEKEFDLTGNLDYVMPTMSVWNRLLQAGSEKRVGETVLLSTIILRETAPQDLYPGLFYDVFANLSSVGLTDISRNLAIAAALGNEKEGS